jgi:hypothetical protein
MKEYSYVILSALISLALLALTRIPVQELGLRLYSIMLLLVTLSSGIAAVVISLIGMREWSRGNPKAMQWIISALIFTIPLIALVVAA